MDTLVGTSVTLVTLLNNAAEESIDAGRVRTFTIGDGRHAQDIVRSAVSVVVNNHRVADLDRHSGRIVERLLGAVVHADKVERVAVAIAVATRSVRLVASSRRHTVAAQLRVVQLPRVVDNRRRQRGDLGTETLDDRGRKVKLERAVLDVGTRQKGKPLQNMVRVGMQVSCLVTRSRAKRGRDALGARKDNVECGSHVINDVVQGNRADRANELLTSVLAIGGHLGLDGRHRRAKHWSHLGDVDVRADECNDGLFHKAQLRQLAHVANVKAQNERMASPKRTLADASVCSNVALDVHGAHAVAVRTEPAGPVVIDEIGVQIVGLVAVARDKLPHVSAQRRRQAQEVPLANVRNGAPAVGLGLLLGTDTHAAAHGARADVRRVLVERFATVVHQARVLLLGQRLLLDNGNSRGQIFVGQSLAQVGSNL